MDLVRLLRNYAGMGKTGAIERMLMTEAADRLERNENLDVPMKQKLKEDREAMYDIMCHIGENNEIWQDQAVYAICKSIHDIITKLEKEDTKNVSERN